MTSRLALVTFKMAIKLSIEETDNSFEFRTDVVFRYLGFCVIKIPVVLENHSSLVLFLACNVQWCDEF